jgi:hypothetical protein
MEDINESGLAQMQAIVKQVQSYSSMEEDLDDEQIAYLRVIIPRLLDMLPMQIEEHHSLPRDFRRLVINEEVCGKNKRLHSLEQLRYPPRSIQDKLNYNRASMKGQTVFYAGSLGRLPVTVETQPRRGQLITESKWKLIDGKVLKQVVIYQHHELALYNTNELLPRYEHHSREMEKLPPNFRKAVELVFDLMIRAFTRAVDPAKKHGYVLSALISEIFMHHPINGVDAIYYPSVPNRAMSMNVAIKPDSLDDKFTMISADESVMLTDPQEGSGGWWTCPTGKASLKENSLDLHWENVYSPPDDPVHSLIKEYNIDLS